MQLDLMVLAVSSKVHQFNALNWCTISLLKLFFTEVL